MGAKGKDKRTASHKGVINHERRNGKAWKKRPCCGKHHKPGACR